MLIVCFYTGHKVYFSSPTYFFVSDYRLKPEAITSANLTVPAKKIITKRLSVTKKAFIIKARMPLLCINTHLLLLDSYRLAPADWYKPESYACVRHLTVEEPYKLDWHTWCTLYYFVNMLPDWFYNNYIMTWHNQTCIKARKKHESLNIILTLTAFTICDERMYKALEHIYSSLIADYEQKTKQQKKVCDTKAWSIDARYDNRLIVKCVEGEGVT